MADGALMNAHAQADIVQSASEHRVLVVGPSWVGDMVMAQSLFYALKKHHPGAQIDVLAPGWSLPVLARMPEVRTGIEMPLKHGELGLLARWRLGHRLRGKYDQAIILPGSFKSALLPFFARIKQRTAYLGEQRYGLINDLRVLDKEVLPMTVQRFVALGQAATDAQPPRTHAPRLRVDADNQQRVLQSLNLNRDKPAVALMPGAEYGPAKQWPLEHFAALARELVSMGKQVWIFGSNKDQAAGEAIVQQASLPNVLNLCGRTQLVDVMDLLALCQAAVSNDSGLMHIAAALDIPTIALYGSSTPEHTPPLSDKAQVIYLALECSPCFKRVCPLGHTRCLADITPQQVWGMLEGVFVYAPDDFCSLPLDGGGLGRGCADVQSGTTVQAIPLSPALSREGRGGRQS